MPNRWVVTGFALVLAGAVLPFLMVIRLLPSTLPLSALSYCCSVGGLFLGLIGAAMSASERRRRSWSESTMEDDERGS